MKLYNTPMSPYVRKVRAVIIEAGLADRVEDVILRPRDPGFEEKNPLTRVPALELDDGQTLFDSPVICEYLDSLDHTGPKLFPPAGPDRWAALRRQALADGIMDAAVPMRQETLRPEAQRSGDWIERWTGMIGRALDALEAEAASGAMPDAADIGTLAVACAVGYLDFRFPAMEWSRQRPALAAWYERFAKRPSIADSVPYEI